MKFCRDKFSRLYIRIILKKKKLGSGEEKKGKVHLLFIIFLAA